jgi:hypothetical protein
VDHLRAGVGLLAAVGDGHRVELADASRRPAGCTLGYFQVIAEPVSTCVQEILEFAPRQAPRLVTKL